jgi:hypothetical protein
MTAIRGVLLAGRFRSYRDLNAMSAEDQRNTLITELAGRTNQPGGHFQGMNDEDLADAGAALVFMRAAAIRDDVTLKTMSDDDQRNTMITEVTAQLGLTGFGLQAFSNRQIVERSLAANSYIFGVLLAGGFRTYRDLDAMSFEDQRNTLITELTGRTDQPVGHYQAMNDEELANAGATLVFLRTAAIRDDATLKTISDDGQRNILITEVTAQLGLHGFLLQGATNLQLVRLALDGDQPTPDEQRVIDLINEQRQQHGCQVPLRPDIRLTLAARGHSRDLADHPGLWETLLEGEPGHIGSDGSTPSDRITAAVGSTGTENVFVGWFFGATAAPGPDDALKWWLNSPPHRTNLLNCDHTTTGVGIATGSGTIPAGQSNAGSAATFYYFTQDFHD